MPQINCHAAIGRRDVPDSDYEVNCQPIVIVQVRCEQIFTPLSDDTIDVADKVSTRHGRTEDGGKNVVGVYIV